MRFEPRRGGELDRQAPLGGRDTETDRQVRLARVGRTEQDHVLGKLNERAARELGHLSSVDALLEREVEALDRLPRRKARQALQHVASTGVGGRQIVQQERLGEVGERPLLVRRLLRKCGHERGYVR